MRPFDECLPGDMSLAKRKREGIENEERHVALKEKKLDVLEKSVNLLENFKKKYARNDREELQFDDMIRNEIFKDCHQNTQFDESLPPVIDISGVARSIGYPKLSHSDQIRIGNHTAKKYFERREKTRKSEEICGRFCKRCQFIR